MKKLAAAVLLVALGSACGAKSGLFGGGGSGLDAGALRPNIDASFPSGDGASGGGGTGGILNSDGSVSECRRLEAPAELAPLDVFFMLDTSGSMEGLTGAGTSKWQAVGDALARFFGDPESRGVGVAMSFFPVLVDGVPELCADDSACGMPGACRKFGVCFPSGIELCDTDADCANTGDPDDRCEPIGRCENDRSSPCFVSMPVGPCANSACLSLGLCLNQGSCAAGDYSTPSVSLGPLPAVQPALTSALSARTLTGPTPTLPAMTGAITAARSWATANPSHKVIVVLATDGLPTVCGSAAFTLDSIQQAVGEVSDAASAGVVDGIQTFVIGVFASEDISTPQQNLDRIAIGGGTGNAFVVSTGGPVADEFLEALVAVRRQANSCEFSIPDVGEPIDFDDLVVTITAPGDLTRRVDRVGGVSTCDPRLGGYYFDAPPTPTRDPGRVILCPATCDRFGSSRERPVELFVECQ